MEHPTEEQLRQRAHQLWETAGQPDGQQEEFWFQAEQELKQEPASNQETSRTFTE